MQTWKPDPTFYPSPKMAMRAPAEELAYVVAFNSSGDKRPDKMCVVNVQSGEIVGETPMPNAGDELHHFGWSACSAALCPYAPHPHVERRYLVVPGIRSSRIHILDTKPDPQSPKIVKVIEAEDIAARAGYSRPHTIHCGAEGVYVSALGGANGKTKLGEDGPGGIFLLDHYDFNVLGKWEVERGPQFLAYDFWWHLGFDSMITSEWGTPSMIEDGVNPELLLGGKYGHCLHIWDLRRRRHKQTMDLGVQHQMALELRPAHDPSRAWGFAGVVVSTEDLSASIWLWRRGENGKEWTAKKIITIPAVAAEEEQLPPLLKGFKAVPPIITDLNLSLDDNYLYVSCWATGEMRQYDVSDPDNPKQTGLVKLGGIVNKTPHPKNPDRPLSGGPQMVEVSRDGRRVYFTNSLYDAWDKQFYPDGIESWMVRLNAKEGGGLEVDKDFFVEFGDFQAHQIRLQGGDSSSDSFCFPN